MGCPKPEVDVDVHQAWGIFLSHYLAESTFAGATQFEYALIGGLSISQSLLISPVVAKSNRYLSTRSTLLIGTVLVFVALFGASYSTKIWHLFLTQGVCFGWGMGFLYITATAVLPQWFSRRRSLALGAASSGAGIGGLAYNLGAGVAAESIGLKWTYRVLAFCTLAVNLTCSLFLKDRNKIIGPSQRSFDHRELVRVEVILVIAWGFFTELGYIVLLYSLPHYATSIGLTQQQGSVIGALFNAGLAIARPIIGHCSDKLGRINVATLMTALCGVFCLALWAPAKGYALLLVFAFLSGTVAGTFWGTMAPVTAEVVGLKRLPSTFGIIFLALVLPTTFAEPIALQIVAASGYLSSQIFVGCMFFLGATSTLFLRSWKISDIESKALVEHETAYSRQQGQRSWFAVQRLFNVRRV